MIREQVLGIVAMEPMGEYDATVKYEKLNIVTYNGSTYCALGDTLGNDPTNKDYWQLIAKEGDKGDTYELTEEDRENIKNEITENANSGFNKNVEEKTTAFDNHVMEKTSSFDTNSLNKTNEFNANATSKLEEYNANADGLMTIAVDTRNELERVKNDVLETGEASGNYLTLNDSTMAEYQELEVDGVCEQITTTGKNLLNFNNYVTSTPTQTWIEIYSGGNPFKETGIYSFSCTGEFGSAYKLWTRHNNGNVHTVNNNGSFEVTEEQMNNIVGVKIVVEGVTAGTTYKGNIYPMIEKGNVATEYEPYTGGKASPNPDYPQEISVIENELKVVSCNKNLFDKENVNVLNTFIDNTNNKMGLDANCRSIFIKCKPNTNYVISKQVTPRFLVGSTSIIPNADVICNSIIRNDSATNISFKTGVNDKYLVVYLMNSYVEEDFIECLNTLQIEENTQATSFEEHLETVINANLGNEFIGKINDTAKDTLRVSYNEEDGEYHLYLDKAVKKVVLTGDENWKTMTYSNLGNLYQLPLDDIYLLSSQIEKGTVVCSHFPTSTPNDVWNYADDGVTNLNSEMYLRFRYLNALTLEEWKAYLKSQYDNNTPVIVYYLMNATNTVDLGVIDMPITYDEVTNLFTDSDLMPIINAKYYRNFTETVRNLQINNDTLKNELASIENRLSALETAQVSVVNESEVVE